MNKLKFYKYRLWQLYHFPYYAFLSNRFVQSYLNRKNIGLYKKNKNNLDALQNEIVEKLEKDGIAVTHIDKLIPEGGVFEPMLEESRELIAKSLSAHGKKVFLREFLTRDFLLDETSRESSFGVFALHNRVMEIVNGYFQMYSKLVFLIGNLAVPVPAGEVPSDSQRWHRDPGFYKICKVFLYLNDVDKETGPFTYLAGSQPGGRWGRAAPHRFFGKGSYYPPDGKVESEIKKIGVPSEDLKICTGEAGTVIFCDTMGLHKGGYATKKERVMTTAFYKLDKNIK